jgi:hypothetical protein
VEEIPSSPLVDLGGGVMPQKQPNGDWSIPNLGWGTFVPPWYPQYVAPIRPPTRKHLLYSTYVKDTYHDVHIRVFKKVIKANGEIVNENIINFLGFTLRNNIFKWGNLFCKIILIILLQNWSKLSINIIE